MHHFKRLLEFDATVAIIIAIVIYGWMPVIDPDFFWHVKNGELIITGSALLTAEPFSHTANGAAITVPGWFFEVLIFKIWDWFGELGVVSLVMLFLVMTWYVMLKTVRLYIDRPESAALISLVGLALLSPVFAPRPNLFTHLAFASVLYLLLRYVQDRSIRGVALLIPLFAIWPNFHYGFAAGIVLILIFIGAAILDNTFPLSDKRPLQPLLNGRFLLLFAVAVLATALNPYGFNVYPELFEMTLRGRNSVVAEWQSPNFKEPEALAVLLSVFAYVTVLFLAKEKSTWAKLIVPATMMLAFFTAVRNVGFWAPIFTAFIAMVLPTTTFWNGISRAKKKQIWNAEPSPNTSLVLNGLAILIAAFAFFVASPVIKENWTKTENEFQPIRATEFMLANIPNGNLFNRYVAGGYLLWKTHPRFPVFIDGRYFPFSDELIRDYRTIASATPGFRNLLEKYQLEIFLLPTNSSLADSLFRSTKHRLVYEDNDNSIFVPNAEKFSGLKQVSRARDKKP